MYNDIIFQVAQAEGTGALQEADRKVVESMLPDVSTLNPLAIAGQITRGGKEGNLASFDTILKSAENRINRLSGVDMNQQDSIEAQPTQPVQQKPKYTIDGAVNWANENPTHPTAKQILTAQKSGTLQEVIDNRNRQEMKEAPVSPTEPAMARQPVGQEITPIETEPKDDWTSRLWEATKEVVPGLTEDIGKRLKNIWGTVSDRQEKQAKGESIFESVINTERQQIRGLGEVAGAVGDVAMRAVELAYKTGVDKKTQEAIKTKASEFLQTPQGQEALSVLQQGTEAWGEFKKSNPEIAKDLEASFNIVTAIPAGKGLGMAGKEAKAITSDVAMTAGKLVGKDAGEKVSNQMFRAVKPTLTVKRNKKMVRENLNSANQELVGQGIKPTNFKEYAEGLSTAKKNVWSKIESKITSAGETASVNLKDISDKLKSIASNQNLLRTDKGAAAKIENMADSLISQGKSVSVQDAELIKQYVNSELSGAFGKFNLSNAEQNAKKLITAEIGKQLDDIMSKVPGEFSGLKKKYGALREIEEDAMKRLIVFERQNPAGLVDSISRISGVGNIIKGIATLSPSEIAKGAGEIAVGQIQKRANDADLIVKKAFERLYKKSPELKSKTLRALKDKIGLTVDFKSPAVGKTALEQEAKKGEILYHGGSKIDQVETGKGNFSKTFYMTDDPNYAKSFGGSKSVVNKMELSPNANLADMRKPSEDLVSQIDQIASGTKTGKTFNIQKPDGKFVKVPETPKDSVSFHPYSKEQVIQGIRDGKAHFAELPEVKKILKQLGYDGQITSEVPYAKNVGVWNEKMVKPLSKSQSIKPKK
jgi:uncharacterized protein YjbJ (UPF0337 family)